MDSHGNEWDCYPWTDADIDGSSKWDWQMGKKRKKTRWKWGMKWDLLGVGHSETFCLIWLSLILFCSSAGSTFPHQSQKGDGVFGCKIENQAGYGSIINCRLSQDEVGNQTISKTTILELIKNQSIRFRHQQMTKLRAVDVICSSLTNPTAINFTELTDYLPLLDSITVSGCNLTYEGIQGTLIPSLTSLNLSHNNLDDIPGSLFQFFPNQGKNSSLKEVDFSNNEGLRSLPKEFLQLSSVQKIRIANSNFSCPWVAASLFPWYERNPLVIEDAKETNCTSRFFANLKNLTVYGALAAKQAEKVECDKVDRRCQCWILTIQSTESYTASLHSHTYPTSFISNGEPVSVTLEVNCNGMNLTNLPDISPLTRVLNVSNNLITTLDRVNTSNYANLKTLTVDNNMVGNVDVLVHTEFVKQFDLLTLNHNRIKSLSTNVLSTLLNTDIIGHGHLSVEGNYLECTCDTYHIKVLLAKHHNKIHDIKNIFCKNLNNVKVHDLEFLKVCPTEDENGMWWYIIIAVEVSLIILVSLKVWHDSRRYRETGILPWCSAKMPRLPCDFMLEGIKEPPNRGRIIH